MYMKTRLGQYHKLKALFKTKQQKKSLSLSLYRAVNIEKKNRTMYGLTNLGIREAEQEC